MSEYVQLEINGNKMHDMVAFQDGIYQCLSCGYWTRKSREVLDTQSCVDGPDDTLIEELEVK